MSRLWCLAEIAKCQNILLKGCHAAGPTPPVEFSFSLLLPPRTYLRSSSPSPCSGGFFTGGVSLVGDSQAVLQPGNKHSWHKVFEIHDLFSMFVESFLRFLPPSPQFMSYPQILSTKTNFFEE